MKRQPPKRRPASNPIKPSERPKQGRSRPSPPPDLEKRPSRPGGRPGTSRPRPALARVPVLDRPAVPDRTSTHVVPLETLARAAVEAAGAVERAVLEEKKHADRTLARVLRDRRELGPNDRMFISQAVFALFRWKGWLDDLPQARPEERLLFAWLLDAPAVHPVCRVWARKVGRDPGRLFSLGGAPNWTARGEGWKRLHEGVPVNADPWRLFPTWLRDHLPLPPGPASPKLRYLGLLQALQERPPIWVRVQGAEPRAIWNEMGTLGIKPWIHRKLLAAARLGPEANVHNLDMFKAGKLEIQDLASQAVGVACDPDPGDRWWDACAGAGGKAIHLASLMQGKGLVVATDVNESKLKETVRRARRSPFRNLTTKVWDGKHVAGKTGSYDGVLVDAPCSAIGTWRRNPDARWTLDRLAIPRLAELQGQLLRAAAAGVKPGGTLVYSVCTLTLAETQEVVRPFLADRPEFRLDPFPDPLTGNPTDGTTSLWPQESDNDAMFIARMVRTG